MITPTPTTAVTTGRVNSPLRHEYRQLTEAETAQIQKIKDLGYDFLEELHTINGSWKQFKEQGGQAHMTTREFSLAATKIEEAVMWATKSISR